jgi:glutathione S-transferase
VESANPIRRLTFGPFVAGAEPSTADAALFPTWVFIEHILPKHFGWARELESQPTQNTPKQVHRG